MPIERDEFTAALYELRRAIDRGFDGTNQRLDTLNGKVYRHESDIAVLQDRADQSRDGHARYAGWGGVLTGVVSLVYSFFHK